MHAAPLERIDTNEDSIKLLEATPLEIAISVIEKRRTFKRSWEDFEEDSIDKLKVLDLLNYLKKYESEFIWDKYGKGFSDGDKAGKDWYEKMHKEGLI